MRWFKHLTNANADRGLSAVTEELGVLGCQAYGIYWFLLEAVAASMEPECTLPSLTHSEAKWASICHCSVRVFRRISERFASENLIIVKSERDRLRIDIPNLLKYRDEYSKRSGVAADNVHARADQSRSDTDKIIPPLPPQGAMGVTNSPIEPAGEDAQQVGYELIAEIFPAHPQLCSIELARTACVLEMAKYREALPSKLAAGWKKRHAEDVIFWLKGRENNPRFFIPHLHVWFRDGMYLQSNATRAGPRKIDPLKAELEAYEADERAAKGGKGK